MFPIFDYPMVTKIFLCNLTTQGCQVELVKVFMIQFRFNGQFGGILQNPIENFGSLHGSVYTSVILKIALLTFRKSVNCFEPDMKDAKTSN